MNLGQAIPMRNCLELEVSERTCCSRCRGLCWTRRTDNGGTLRGRTVDAVQNPLEAVVGAMIFGSNRYIGLKRKVRC